MRVSPLLVLLALAGCSTQEEDSAPGQEEAGCARIKVDPLLLHWEGLQPGESQTGTFTVSNTCTAAL